MFRTDQFGRLDYTYFLHYSLPELVRVLSKNGKDERLHAEFVRHGAKDTDGDGYGPPSFRKPLYRLRWPGETDRPATTVPYTEEMSRVEWMKPGVNRNPPLVVDDEGRVLLPDIWSRWSRAAGAILPERIAYHIAVNPHCMGREEELVTPSVAGLPADRVREVLDTEFAIDAGALSTLEYLKWTAESHHNCPFFWGFDTNIRETLYGLQHEAVRLYFYLLADYRYDAETRWWDRGTSRFVWQRLATYLHWVGRTGAALYGQLAHISPAEGIRPDVVEEHMQDVLEGDRRWRNSIGYMIDEDGSPVGPSYMADE